LRQFRRHIPSFALETTVLSEAGWWAPSDAALDARTIHLLQLGFATIAVTG
jgi:hypothetical protein